MSQRLVDAHQCLCFERNELLAFYFFFERVGAVEVPLQHIDHPDDVGYHPLLLFVLVPRHMIHCVDFHFDKFSVPGWVGLPDAIEQLVGDI